MIFFEAVILYLLGFQFRFADLSLIGGRINYRPQFQQFITFASLFVAILLIIKDFSQYKPNISFILLMTILSLILSFIIEFILSKINSRSFLFNIFVRLVAIIAVSLVICSSRQGVVLPCFVMGLFTTNNPFSIVHGKPLRLASYFRRKLIRTNCEKQIEVNTSALPIFKYAGRNLNFDCPQLLFNVVNYEIIPNKRIDYTQKVNELIEKVGNNGGGRIFFPAGKYYFNKTQSQCDFIQINHSNVTIEGELDSEGRLLTEFICCGNLVKGHKNPWLSPFLITTGERLQSSNWFWGLQFRKKKNIITKSSSSSDPGSDGTILSPEFTTSIIADAFKGENTLRVMDSTKIGKYILVGLYNNDLEGSLIKDILGQDLKPEWKTALRAGEEQAPSFQWLVEVASIIDQHTIKLSQPLWRDCLVKYVPAIFNVEMLENICIRNLRINSTWNGLFLHHGFRPYYSIKQAQEMDYGWNAINMKRVAHGLISNVEISNFTNPLYIMDSKNATVEHVKISGFDGHQGIKLYEHACDNLLKDITFLCHYADMMGGEGNAYGNVFTDIHYLNPEFKPCEYDFHGFSEGPMSPPAYNLFDNVTGFRYIKMAGADYNQPACAQWNIWWNCTSEGERRGDSMFHSIHYFDGISINKRVGIAFRSLLKINPKKISSEYKRRVNNIKRNCVDKESHSKLFKNAWIFGLLTTFMEQNNDSVHMINTNQRCKPESLIS